MNRDQELPGQVDPEPTQAIADMAALLAEPSEPLAVPALMDRIAGRYELGPVIGRGGVADVHRAQDTLLDREVAVKLLRQEATSEADRARFTAEARTLAQLSDPGLVTVLDAGTSDDHPYLVMELVEGTNLAAALEAGPLGRGEAARILRVVAEALAYAHGQGVVHRDVKPGNVLVGHDGRVKLADFGIARLVGDAIRHTATGTTIGTVSYLAPEQVTGGELTQAVDIYALGLVLLESVTGERAFIGPTAEAALARLTRDPEVPTDLPPAWQDLLRAMTAREAADRPSAEQVVGRLTALEHGSTHDLVPLAPTAGAGRRRPLAGMMASAALVAAAMIIAGTGVFGAGEPTAAGRAVPDRTPSVSGTKKAVQTPAPAKVASSATAPPTAHAGATKTKPKVTKPKVTKPKVTKPKANAKPKSKGKGKGKGRR
ncbi:serine/threonine protein kinase [Nocardioides szechwanensis]|uniref:non-specific serine/threonine protein kinase n=1 Tax=Nocardioides szechwanensis TaxID=1005944 RepID=A0A1H0A7V7_9ACTN|nr:serine/threonine-protein kinase [Nocardioides szechwanensis]GEP34942.1 serine/threonine protein kinase [Nocardioides szechwanensis]SDN29294.1 Serine/threonine protein kinase [Nocardioides szechwanensis]